MKPKADVIAFSSQSTEFADALKGKCTLVFWEDTYCEIHFEPEKDKVFNMMPPWMDTHLDK